jgi:hypothetical protein
LIVDYRFTRLCAAIALCSLAVACDGKQDDSGESVAIRGGDRLGWYQPATSVQALRAHTFRLYVDGSPAEFPDVICGEPLTAAGYLCSGLLPLMSPGRHTLEMTTVANGIESQKSVPLVVIVNAGVSAIVAPFETTSAVASERLATTCAASRDDCYDLSVLAQGLDSPSELTPTSDGRLFFVEARRQIRVVADGMLLPDPALAIESARGSQIVGLAADSSFEQTRAFFVAWTEESRRGGSVLNITRYREINHSLGEGARIVTGLPIPADAPAPLAVGRDGLLYVAIPGDPNARHGPGSALSGSLFRFDRDGLTPATNPRPQPLIASGFTHPSTLMFDLESRRLWLGSAASSSRIGSIVPASRRGGPWPLQLTLLDTSSLVKQSGDQTSGTGLAFAGPESMLLAVDGAVFVATPTAEGRLPSIDRLLLDAGVPLSVAGTRDGVWYVASRTREGTARILRLDRRP